MTSEFFSSDPVADPLKELEVAVQKTMIMKQVLKLGIFEDINNMDNCVTAETFASKKSYDPDVTARLLNALVSFGFLISINEDGVNLYRNSPSTQRYLIKGNQPSLVPNIMSLFDIIQPVYDELPNVLKTGQGSDKFTPFSTKPKPGNVANGELAKDPVIEMPPNRPSPTEFFMSVMDGTIGPSIKAIAQSYDFSQYYNLVDVGGSSGILAYEFLRVYDQMKAVVVELEQSVEIARKRQPPSTSGRLEFVARDMFTDPIPEGDLIFLGHVIHNWDLNKIKLLLNKCYKSLKSGGCILIGEKFLYEDKTGPDHATITNLAMAIMVMGRERTRSEYQQLLNDAGFIDVESRTLSGCNTYDVMVGYKPKYN